MKEIEKYVGYYLGVYVVVLAICGFFQYFYYCQGQSLMCAVTKTGIVDIVTVTAYVLTPIVAIIGFLSWKHQHNKLVLADEAKELLIAINDDIKLFTDISGYLRSRENNLAIRNCIAMDYLARVRRLGDNVTNVSSKALVLYELTDDEDLNMLRIEYHEFTNNLYMQLINDFMQNITIREVLE